MFQQRLPHKKRRAVYINCDGLGRDWIRLDTTPRLWALCRQSASASNHRAIFPSVTRPSAASVATGCWPQRHGLLGNRVALLEEGRLVVRDVGLPDFRDHLRRATGTTLRAPTLAERVSASGGFIAFSNVSPGAGYFLDPDHHGFIYHRAGSFAPGGIPIVGKDHLAVSHDLTGDVAMTERFCREVIEESEVRVAVLWLANPDLTLHRTPLGSPLHIKALQIVDECVGQVLASIEAARASGDDILFLVGSDHGQETIGESVSIENWLADQGCAEDVAQGLIAVTAQGTSALIYALPGARSRIVGLLPAMAAQPWVGEVLAGLPLKERCHLADEHLVAIINMGATDVANPFGVSGQRFVCIDGEKPANIGCGQHGGLGADETRPFLLLDHPKVASKVLNRATSLIDIAPTILGFLGLPSDDLDGRSILDEVPELAGATPLRACQPT